MLKPPRDLSKARILISNDDGIHAPGIRALERIARTLSDDVWVVAPDAQRSAAGHSLTIHDPLRTYAHDDRHISVDGTPTDAVYVAVNYILKDHKPDIVFSGVNMGLNLADDVTYSGTVAAAMEATLMGIPAIAFSQQRDREKGVYVWDVAEKWAPDVIRNLIKFDWPDDVLMNVNFPSCKPDEVSGIKTVPLGKHKPNQDLIERLDPNGDKYLWIGAPPREFDPSHPTDIGVLAAGGIPVTPLTLNLTHEPTMDRLEKIFA